MTDDRAAPPSASQPSASQAAGGGDIFNDPTFLRNMKIAVVVMAVILILGFIAIIARIFYLSSRTPAQPPKTAVTAMPQATDMRPLDQSKLAERGRLDLPPNAVVRSMALSGARLAVQYDAPSGGGIAILDLETGRALSRIEIGNAPGR